MTHDRVTPTAVAAVVALLGLAGAAPAAAEDAGPLDFGATMRVDLHHVGDARTQRYLVDEVRREGAWPGPRTGLARHTGYGCSQVQVFGPGKDGALLYVDGFCTLFGEWRTTDEARTRSRVFSETVRFPWPRGKVRLVIRDRDSKSGRLVPVLETELDPGATSVSRERPRGGLEVVQLHRGGPPERCLDVVVLGDGYEAWQMDKYRADAARFTRVLLATPPFAGYAGAINVWGVLSPSRQSGVDEPRKGIWRDTVLGMSFNTFGSARYLMTTDNKSMRDVAANVPYDAIYLMANASRYGGGGIYNLYAAFVSDNEYDRYVFVHEFGHSFAGLADEYYTSSVAYSGMYPRGVEPWEPNITAQTRRGNVKWGARIAADTPVPTPEGDPRYRQRVGLFEGAGYSAKGLYRSSVDCKMFGKAQEPFCPVCMAAVQAMVERHTGGAVKSNEPPQDDKE